MVTQKEKSLKFPVLSGVESVLCGSGDEFVVGL
jgi:hypothetical protein